MVYLFVFRIDIILNRNMSIILFVRFLTHNYFVWYYSDLHGTIVGTVAFFMGGKNVPFAFSIFIAQFVGILTAGCTGTLAPLLFTFIFERDSGKWGGPLETAVQDVVGSFAMIVISYQVMSYFGPYDIERSDMCGVAE